MLSLLLVKIYTEIPEAIGNSNQRENIRRGSKDMKKKAADSQAGELSL